MGPVSLFNIQTLGSRFREKELTNKNWTALLEMSEKLLQQMVAKLVNIVKLVFLGRLSRQLLNFCVHTAEDFEQRSPKQSLFVFRVNEEDLPNRDATAYPSERQFDETSSKWRD